MQHAEGKAVNKQNIASEKNVKSEHPLQAWATVSIKWSIICV